MGNLVTEKGLTDEELLHYAGLGLLEKTDVAWDRLVGLAQELLGEERDQLNTLEREIEELEDQVNDLETELAAAEDENSMLEDEIQSLKDELEERGRDEH